MLRILFMTLCSLLLSSVAGAAAIDMTCKSKKSIGFRNDIASKSEWSEEQFNDTWRIQYDGVSEEALVDGRAATAVKVNNTLILVRYDANETAQSVWSYAIFMPTKEMTASQVNVYDVMGVGLKSRIIEFVCI